MKGSRTKNELKAKVIETKINNPDSTLREIEKETGVNYETSRKILKEDLPEVVKSSDAIADLIDRNNSLQSLGDEYLAEMLENKDERVTAPSLVSLRESTFKQNQLLTGGATENLTGLSLVELHKNIEK